MDDHDFKAPIAQFGHKNGDTNLKYFKQSKKLSDKA